jgi:hypothetical protein
VFETLITYAIAYYRAHPDALERYRAFKTHEEVVDEAYQFTTWSLTTPPWNSPEMQQRLDDESQRLYHAPTTIRARFFAAKNAAIVQLEYGEHA